MHDAGPNPEVLVAACVPTADPGDVTSPIALRTQQLGYVPRGCPDPTLFCILCTIVDAPLHDSEDPLHDSDIVQHDSEVTLYGR